jgi:hypothetical protein
MERKAFKTTDLALSAFLLCRGHPLEGLEKDGHRGVFVFSEGVERDSQLYMNGHALVEPGAYNTSIRKLKAKLSEIIFN